MSGLIILVVVAGTAICVYSTRAFVIVVAAALILALSMSMSASVGAYVPSTKDDPTITAANEPIVAFWWASHGVLIVTIYEDVLHFASLHSQKHPSFPQEFAVCKALSDKDTTSALNNISNEQNAVDQDTSSTQAFWESLYLTVLNAAGSGNICFTHSTSGDVHVSAKSGVELRTSIMRLKQVFSSLEAAGIPTGLPLSLAPSGTSDQAPTSPVASEGLGQTEQEIRSVFDSSSSHSISWRSAPLNGGTTPRLLGLEGACNFEIIGSASNVQQADDFCIAAGATDAQSRDEAGIFLSLLRKFGNMSDERWFAARVKASETSTGHIETSDAKRTDGSYEFEVQTSASFGTIEVIVTHASSTPTTTSDLPGVLQCAPSTAPPVVRPTLIYFGCASGDISMTNITWQSWNSSSAIGTGTLNVNTGAGQEQTFASATVDVSDPGMTDGQLVFQQAEAGPTGLSSGPAETGTQPGEDWGVP